MSYHPQWDFFSLMLYLIMGILNYVSVYKVKKREFATRKKQSIFSREYVIWYIAWIVVAVGRKVANGIGGSDAITYVTYFECCLEKNSTHIYASHVDLLYKLLNQSIRFIISDYHVLFFVIYTILIISYILCVNEFAVSGSSMIPLMILFYVYLRGFTSIRSNLSAAMVLFSIVLLKNKKYSWSILLAIASVFMQKAAIFYAAYLIIFFMYQKKKLTIKTCIIFMALSTVLSYGVQKIILSFNFSFLESGAYVSYVSESIGSSFFDNFWKIAFSQILLFIVLVIFRKSIDKYIANLGPENQERAQYIRLLSYFDIILIPTTFVLNIWRGYEYFYIIRLLMWGVIIEVVCKKFDLKSRKFVRAFFAIVFVGWMVFRINSTYESSYLMPYVFELFE